MMFSDPNIEYGHTYLKPSQTSYSILGLLMAFNNAGPDVTGPLGMAIFSFNVVGNRLPSNLMGAFRYSVNNVFGNYPVPSDFAPSIVFAVVFFVLGFIHLALFCFNLSRGHYFYGSLLWFMYGMGKGIGFSLRAQWSHRIEMINLGITSEIFLVISSVALATINLILAQRLFTWRHPVGGSRKLFDNIFLVQYFLVILVVVLTIVASCAYYVYFLSYYSEKAYQYIVMVTAVLIIFYTLAAMALVFLSYFFKPTRKDENLYTYQPWWIESFHPFYFVKKNAAREAEETFMKRNHNHRHAVRVIAATRHHYNMVEGLSNERGDLKHNTSIIIIFITTLLTFVEALLRAIVCFKPQPTWHDFVLARPIVAYMVWGVLEVLVNLLYLIGRVDLRFYRPDRLPAKVRAIITAEQSYYGSENEDDDSSMEFSTTDEAGEYFNFNEEHSSEKDLERNTEPPVYEDHARREKGDTESEFHF